MLSFMLALHFFVATIVLASASYLLMWSLYIVLAQKFVLLLNSEDNEWFTSGWEFWTVI